MALSRLANLASNPTGVKLFVDPGNFDATDNIENRGNSPNRPFYSLQRCLIEAALYSFVPGRNNDRNDRTTIIVSPGTHYIDNRPGFSIQNLNNSPLFKRKTSANTWTTDTLNPFNENTNFDIFDPNNDLYKYNSITGGVILPRGTSIVGQDLRKTKIRPLFVPDPLDADVEVSSIFNVTGSCYFNNFTFFDADVTKFSYKNYSNTKHVPRYSHHKLTSFVYADGVTKVKIGSEQTELTDLDMYYYKVARAYDSLSGRGIEDFPPNLDFEPNVNEFRIVGPLQENPLGISSIRAGNGDGTGDNSIITVTTANLQSKIEQPHNFAVDTPIIIKGITQSPNSYNGSFTVREVVGVNTFTFITPSIPSEVLPNPSSFDIATVSVESDTVSSSSPYIFNCSLRSVYGMCGMLADGSKAEGFKSMVVAQFTGVSLQKDNDVYLIYDNGVYYDNLTLPASSQLRPLYQNSRSIYKPNCENYHIKATNDAFIQVVSVFAIGFANHFITESGADMSITNSNSNFGSNSLNSVGFKKNSFDRDDTGYITHIIPPKELLNEETEVSWLSLDISKTRSVSNPKKLYIYLFDNKDIIPTYQVSGFRIGARKEDKLYLTITTEDSQQLYSCPIFMTTPDNSEGSAYQKSYRVSRSGLINEIISNKLTLTTSHKLFTGEKIRIFSDTAQAPEGLNIDKIYYAITSSTDGTLNANEIRLASSLNDALSNQPITGIGNNGGIITVISSVSDKEPGDYGHPIQWDELNSNWYINSSQFAINQIYTAISGLDPVTFGDKTPLTFFKRIEENRSIDERLYKFRYVIPKEYINAKAPQVGYILQESKNVAISTISFNENISLKNSTEIRNEKIIVNATTGSIVNGKQTVTILTEKPHNFVPSDIVKIQSIKSTNNSSGVGIVSTYNGEYKVLTVPSSRTFTYQLEGLKVNPGTFTNNINQRTTTQQRNDLPLVSRQSYKNNFYIYKVETIREQVPGTDGKDGIYHLTVLSSSVGVKNNVGYGLSEKKFSQDIRNLYPQIDRDNPSSNPNATISYADLKTLGKVITNDKKNSITLETLNEFNKNTKIGFEITNVSLSGVGNTVITLTTDVEHKLNSIASVSFVSNGAGYPINNTFYSANLIKTGSTEESSTCKYSTTGTGAVNSTSFRLVDVGAAHTVGERLQIEGSLTSNNAQVQVTQINNNIGDGLELSGFYTTELNGLYEILEIPSKKTIKLYAPKGVLSYTANTAGITPLGYIASKGVSISSITLSNLDVGIATVRTSYPHGLTVGNKFKITNTNVNQYNNNDYIVSSVVGINTFTFNVGIATTTTTVTRGKIFKYGISSNFLNLGKGEENLTSRACHIYSGLSVLLNSNLDVNSASITVDNSNGLFRGDYILINNEILRVASVPISNSFFVLRNQLGTVRTTASSGTVAKKIKIYPAETRRPSFMRASGHTFEYLGYGPGNYSTSLPQRQDRSLSEDEVILSQAKKQNGGSIVYSGMNDLGEFYTGSSKISATTGEETVFNAPVITYTGDDANTEVATKKNAVYDEILIKERLTVEGGENNNQSSQFYGPVNFNSKITNLSNEGISLRNLYLRGNLSQEKLITVGISTPTSATIPTPIAGDISFLSNPTEKYIGHIYKNNNWRQWGLISNEANKLNFTVDKIGIGTDPNDTYNFNVQGTARIQNLLVTEGVTFSQQFNLGDVKFEQIEVSKTATFSGTGVTYTQIHSSGISRLNKLEVVGISSFYSDVYINRPDQFGVSPTLYVNKLDLANIRVGIANSNTIDTKFGGLTLKSTNSTITVDGNLNINGNVAITTSRNIGLPGLGVVTSFITESRLIRLGVGNTNQSSYIDFNNDIRVFSDYGLRIIRNSGIGSQSSELIHKGNLPLQINAFDNGSDIRLLTANTERLRVGTSGTVTIFNNNNGENLGGNHLRLTQAGSGDVALSWDITFNNANVRWYSGIDVSDGNSWKLANPSTSVIYGNENFDTDTKLKIDTSGNLTLTSSTGNISLNGLNLTSSSNGTFNLLNTNISVVNAFGNADTVNLAKSSITSKVNILGTTPSTSTSTGALVVSGGVGIAGALNVGNGISVPSGNVVITNGLTVNGSSQLSSATISGGTINGTIIGGTTRAAASFTSINVNANSDFNGAVLDRVLLKRYGEIVVNLGNISGNTTINLADGNVFLATLVGNVSFSFINQLTQATSGTSFTLFITNGTGGPFSVTWPVTVKFPNNTLPPRTTADGKTDLWNFITPDQGTTWYGNLSIFNFS